MNTFSSRRSVTIAAGCLAAIVSITAIALATPDTKKKITPNTASFSISPLPMTPHSDDVDYATDDQGGGRIFVLSNFGCFATAVHLPQGARITGLTAIFSSQPGPPNVSPSFSLVRSALFFVERRNIALESVPDNTPNRTAWPAFITNNPEDPIEVVNNNDYYYHLDLCLVPNDAFYGARITYTLPTTHF
jgi:hypothetical protein